MLFEPPRLLIFKKISSLPVFLTYTNEKFSTLPAVNRAYPLIEFEKKNPAYPFFRDLRVSGTSINADERASEGVDFVCSIGKK